MRSLFAVLALCAFAFTVNAPLQTTVVDDVSVEQVDSPDAPAVITAMYVSGDPDAVIKYGARYAVNQAAVPAVAQHSMFYHRASLPRPNAMSRPIDVDLVVARNYESGLTIRRC